MNVLMFLPLLLLGLGTLVAGAVSMSMGRKRKPIMIAIGGGLIGLAAAAGVLIPDGSATAATPTTTPNASAGVMAFLYPAEAEELNAQDFILEGTGVTGENLEIYKNGVLEGTTSADANSKWSFYVPTPAVGEYEFEVKAADGSSIKRKVIVKQGLTTASNAQCPCRVRVSAFTNGKVAVNGTVILSKDGVEVARGTTPNVFEGLAAGSYTYSIEAEGFQTFNAGKIETPKNKNIPVYLKK